MCNGARGVGEKWNSRLRLARDEIYGWASMRMGSKHLLDIEQNCNHIVIYEAAEREREQFLCSIDAHDPCIKLSTVNVQLNTTKKSIRNKLNPAPNYTIICNKMATPPIAMCHWFSCLFVSTAIEWFPFRQILFLPLTHLLQDSQKTILQSKLKVLK